jgi:hypothetical protein
MTKVHDREAVRVKTPTPKPTTKPYVGILAQPMPEWTALTRPTDDEFEAVINEKFKALFAHYEIDPTGAFGDGPNMASVWANLAFHLAREHVPGFGGAPRKRGKPVAPRKQLDDVTLVMRVELFTRRDRLSVRKAIGKIAAENLVLGTEQALQQRYKRAKGHFKPLSRMFDNIVAAKGHDAFVRVMEESISGDDKEIFLSPD